MNFLLALFFCTFQTSANASDKSDAVQNSSNPFFITATKSKETVGELIEGMYNVDLITTEEKNSMIDVLNQLKINTTDKLTKAVIKGHRIIWGNTALKISEDDELQTEDGVYIRKRQNESADQFFSRTLGILNGPKTSRIDLIISKAWAQQKRGQSLERASAALDVTFSTFCKGFRKSGDFLSGISMATLGCFAAAIGVSVQELKNYLNGKKVTCSRDHRYQLVLNKKYTDWQQYYQGYKEKQEKSKENYANLNAKGMAGLSVFRDAFYDNSFQALFLNDQTLNRVWSEYNQLKHITKYSNGKKYPDCNNDKAKIVEAYIKIKEIGQSNGVNVDNVKPLKSESDNVTR